MPRDAIDTLDDYERHLAATLDRFSPAQRTAFAAAMAERWIYVYLDFSERAARRTMSGSPHCSLLVGDAAIGDFHDWPDCWTRVPSG